jgi:hypothetical protein
VSFIWEEILMIIKKSWKEFRDIGMLWWVNMIMHTFGWALVYVFDDNGEITEVYPARVKFRGFDGKTNDKGYQNISKYLKENAEELEKESLE